MTVPSREDMMLSLQDLAERGVDWEWQSRNRSCWLLGVSLARDRQAWDFLSLAFTSDLASQHRDHWPSDRYQVSLSCGHWWRSPNWFSCFCFSFLPLPLSTVQIIVLKIEFSHLPTWFTGYMVPTLCSKHFCMGWTSLIVKSQIRNAP